MCDQEFGQVSYTAAKALLENGLRVWLEHEADETRKLVYIGDDKYVYQRANAEAVKLNFNLEWYTNKYHKLHAGQVISMLQAGFCVQVKNSAAAEWENLTLFRSEVCVDQVDFPACLLVCGQEWRTVVDFIGETEEDND